MDGNGDRSTHEQNATPADLIRFAICYRRLADDRSTGIYNGSIGVYNVRMQNSTVTRLSCP